MEQQDAPSFIALEEHFLLDKFFSRESMSEIWDNSFPTPVGEKLLHVDDQRIQNMDDTGITRQVLSHLSLDTAVDESREINQTLYAHVQRHPSRLAGFAQLPMRNPEAAAAELDYAVRTLGFLGALIPNHLDDGTFYDTPAYDVVFARAQELDVPLYLHPAYPSQKARQLLYSGPFPQGISWSLGGWCWGWHSTVGLHVLRLYATGVFERFPRLKLVIGHMGEMLPFMLDRMEPMVRHWPEAASRSRSLRHVWDSNVWVTTSGMFSMAVMRCLLGTTRVDRILYSVDYPLASNENGLKFLKELQASGEVTEDEFRAITNGNAARLLKLDGAGTKIT